MQRSRFTGFLTFSVCAWALCAATSASYADTPEVMVDMSVLQGLAPAAGDSATTTLSRPAPKGWRPALTAPEPEPVAPPPAPVVQAPPAVKQTVAEKSLPVPEKKPASAIAKIPAKKPAAIVAKAVHVPIPASKPVIAAMREAQASRPVDIEEKTARKTEEPKIETSQVAAIAEPPAPIVVPKIEAPKAAAPAVVKPSGIQKFPVQMRTVTESTDPALTPTPTLASKDDSGMLPLPAEDITETPAPRKTAMATPPVPRRRPDIQQASSSFVAAAREKAKLAARKEESSPMPPLAAIVKQNDGPPVMAMPPGAIKAEQLAAIRMPESDRLAQQIVNPSKAALVDAIEKISSRTQEQSGAPKLRPPQMIASTPLMKEDIVDITANVPAKTEPEAKDITARVASADKETEEAARIQPAAGNAQGHIPRLPQDDKFEEEFVTLKFDAGVREPDEKVQSEMESNILTLLRKNPAWRVQIQAFASPDGADVSNARRISLARALAIRTWLMDKGVEASRMDVRALGAETDRNPADRVDMVFFDPKKNG